MKKALHEYIFSKSTTIRSLSHLANNQKKTANHIPIIKQDNKENWMISSNTTIELGMINRGYPTESRCHYVKLAPVGTSGSWAPVHSEGTTATIREDRKPGKVIGTARINEHQRSRVNLNRPH